MPITAHHHDHDHHPHQPIPACILTQIRYGVSFARTKINYRHTPDLVCIGSRRFVGSFSPMQPRHCCPTLFLFLDPIGEDTQETEDKEGDDGKEGRWILGRVSRSLFFFVSLPKPNITPEKVRVFQKGGGGDSEVLC